MGEGCRKPPRGSCEVGAPERSATHGRVGDTVRFAHPEESPLGVLLLDELSAVATIRFNPSAPSEPTDPHDAPRHTCRVPHGVPPQHPPPRPASRGRPFPPPQHRPPAPAPSIPLSPSSSPSTPRSDRPGSSSISFMRAAAACVSYWRWAYPPPRPASGSTAPSVPPGFPSLTAGAASPGATPSAPPGTAEERRQSSPGPSTHYPARGGGAGRRGSRVASVAAAQHRPGNVPPEHLRSAGPGGVGVPPGRRGEEGDTARRCGDGCAVPLRVGGAPPDRARPHGPSRSRRCMYARWGSPAGCGRGRRPRFKCSFSTI